MTDILAAAAVVVIVGVAPTTARDLGSNDKRVREPHPNGRDDKVGANKPAMRDPLETSTFFLSNQAPPQSITNRSETLARCGCSEGAHRSMNSSSKMSYSHRSERQRPRRL